MIFFVLVLLLIIFRSARIAPENCFHEDYLSVESTNVIKGIFVILILFSHGKSYIDIGGLYDDPYVALQNHLNQMVVVMFFFYSGYGMMEQTKKKGFDYVKTIPAKRFPKLMLNFDVAVCWFLLANLLIGNQVTLKSFLLSLIAWGTIGNSNWYIFAILVLYLLCYVAFLPLRWNNSEIMRALCTTILTLLSISFVYAQMKVGRPKYCYNTIIIFSMGYWYSLMKKPLEKCLMKSDLGFSLAAALILAVYVFCYFRRWRSIEYYSVWAVCFTTLTVLLTMKIEIKSAFLEWFGKHIFSVFILQRIPFMWLDSMPFFDKHKYFFLICSFAATIPLALVFERITNKINNLLWKNNNIFAENMR